MNIDELLRTTAEMGGSDLHIKPDCAPLVRLHGEMVPLEMPPLSAEQAQHLCFGVLTQEQQARFEADHELDFSYVIPEVARFRGSLYRQRGRSQCVYRVIPLHIRTLEDLRLPPVCRYFAERPHGLVLVSGQACSGKSTMVAAMIDYINRHFSLHILTVEDPVEFIHQGVEAFINQREVGQDTPSAESALKSALRQDTDVLFAGELHTPAAISLALTAAETGHLVFGTLAMPGAVPAVDHLVDLMPPHQQPQTRMRLSTNLIGVVCQTLVRMKDGTGKVAAFETLVGVPSVRGLIREGKTSQIHALMQTGFKQGMMTQDQSLAGLVKKGVVTYDAALEHAHSITEFHFLCTEGQTASEVTFNGSNIAQPSPHSTIPAT